MILAEAIVEHVLGDETITKHIADRIGPVGSFEGERQPYIVYFQDIGPREQIMGISGIAYPTYRFEVYDRTYLDSHILADRVRVRFDSNTETTWGDVRILASIITDQEDLGPINITETSQLYGVAIDVEIWHAEATT